MGTSMPEDTQPQGNDAAVTEITLGPIQGSEKAYVDVDGMAVPFRRVNLTNGEHFDLYDTSGPYTDSSAVIDLENGLPKTRDTWERPEPVVLEATGTTAAAHMRAAG